MALTSSSPTQPSTLDNAYMVMDEMITLIKERVPEECGIRVSDVILGGSLGMMTELPGRYDADIIIYSPDISVKEVLRNGYGIWLNRLNQFFQSEKQVSQDYKFYALTDKGLQFTYSGIEVEILVTPPWRKPTDLYTFLETAKPQHRNKFLQGAAKWQVQFFKQQPSQRSDFRREFIKRAKAWRDLRWSRGTGGHGRPSSLLLSLLVIKAYESAQKSLGVFSMLSPDTLAYHTAEELKNIVYNFDTLNIYWEQCYTLRQYPTLVPPRPPRIIDPANPAHNLYATGIVNFDPNTRCGEYDIGTGDWRSLIRNIGTLDLSKPVKYWT